MQNEVCAGAAIQKINPPLFPLVVIGNQFSTKLLAEIALYAVQVAAGYGGVKATKRELERLNDEIDERLLNSAFIGYIPNEGTRVKNFVRDAARRRP